MGNRCVKPRRVGLGISLMCFLWIGGDIPTTSTPILRLLLELAPVLELVLVHLDVDLRDALLESLLHVGDGLVVDARPDLSE